MVPVGIGISWLGYALFFWGRALVKGYDISFKEIISPTAYYQGKWPPPPAPSNVIFPAGGQGNIAPAANAIINAGAKAVQKNSTA